MSVLCTCSTNPCVFGHVKALQCAAAGDSHLTKVPSCFLPLRRLHDLDGPSAPQNITPRFRLAVTSTCRDLKYAPCVAGMHAGQEKLRPVALALAEREK